MKNTELLAIVDAIKTGFWNREQLSLMEFEAIHAAVAQRMLELEEKEPVKYEARP